MLLIVLDDVGFAHLGCYGSTISTPCIDALAAEGRRYTNFHTTAMCSPTRASLLTGRNHHAVGMGIIADMCTGFPGYQGQVDPEVPTLAELLKPAGFSTFAIGKWHLTRAREMTAAGPFDQWPLGRGFERYYGFLYSLVDQWHPELVSDNHFIPTPSHPGYHLSEDLVDHTIDMIRDAKSADPLRPFFAYLAFGACHSPHQAPKEYIDRYAGAFDEGWDVMRERWFARQLELGVSPRGTRLTPRNEEVKPWADLSHDEQRVCARHQEVFAGFLEHTDAQIGRLTAWLRTAGLLDDTVVMVMSDNGASAEGGALGNLNLRRYVGREEPESLEEHLAALDELGSDRHWNTYPAGWGHAGNTPHKWFKMQTHGGGVRDPLIMRWPKAIPANGLIGTQFCHCSDIAPTILELAGVEALAMDGTSLAYTFADADAPTRKRIQYFELMGNRGIWSEGWKAVARHYPGTDYEVEPWELYHLDEDFSEATDLSATRPGKLEQLKALWEQEASANRVFPLDDRNLDRLPLTYYVEPRVSWTYQPGMSRVSGYAAPPLGARSYRIEADVELSGVDSGVILASGGASGGYVLFMDSGRLVHEYVGPRGSSTVETEVCLPAGRRRLSFDFRKTGVGSGLATLRCDDVALASQQMTGMWLRGPSSNGLTCGFDEGSPVSARYVLPAVFTGQIHRVTVEAGPWNVDTALELEIALAED